MNCDGFEVREGGTGYYVSSLERMPEGMYVHRDLTVQRDMSVLSGKNNYHQTRESAEELLRRFKEKMCSKVKDKESINRPFLLLEGEENRVQPITARLVSDRSGGRIVLQVQTSETPEFIPIARLGVKNGKVVMYRERGVESEFINTDSEGRIQN